MTDTLARLAGPSAFGSGTNTVLTVPSGPDHTYTIRLINVVNMNASPNTVSMYIDGAADANIIMPPVAIDSNGSAVFSGVLTLEAGDTLVIVTSLSGVTVTVSGLDQS